MNARSAYTSLDGRIVSYTLATENEDIDLDEVSLSLDIPDKIDLIKARIKNREGMKELEAYAATQNSAYRRTHAGFSAFPIEE